MIFILSNKPGSVLKSPKLKLSKRWYNKEKSLNLKSSAQNIFLFQEFALNLEKAIGRTFEIIDFRGLGFGKPK